MIHRLHISDRDRLLAAGLLSFILALFLFSPADTRSFQTLIVLGVFASGALVFSLSPLFRGSPIQRWVALFFLLPPVAYLITLCSVLLSGGLR